MISLEETSDGVLLPVQAQPKARKNAIVGTHDGRLKIAVTQPPEKGKANAALMKLLATSLKLRRSQIELISGVTSSKKMFRITGVERADVSKQIQKILEK